MTKKKEEGGKLASGVILLGGFLLYKRRQAADRYGDISWAKRDMTPEEHEQARENARLVREEMKEEKQKEGLVKVEVKVNEHDGRVDNAFSRESFGTLSNGVEVLRYQSKEGGVTKGAFVDTWTKTVAGPKGPITATFKYRLSGDPLYGEYKRMAKQELA